MDGLSGIREPLPDVGAADRARDASRQTRGRSKGTARRGAKEGQPGPMTTSDDGSESLAEEGGDSMQQGDHFEQTANDRELSAKYYGADKTVAQTPPSKGRLIDIAI